MISVDEFGRLDPLAYVDREGCHFSNTWLFLGRMWHHVGNGFTAFLAEPDEPDVARCLCVDLYELPLSTAARLLQDLDLPISAGMDIAQLAGILGDPVSEKSFTSRRVSYEFRAGEFTIDATIEDVRGLTYLVIHPPLPPENIPDEYDLHD